MTNSALPPSFGMHLRVATHHEELIGSPYTWATLDRNNQHPNRGSRRDSNPRPQVGKRAPYPLCQSTTAPSTPFLFILVYPLVGIICSPRRPPPPPGKKKISSSRGIDTSEDGAGGIASHTHSYHVSIAPVWLSFSIKKHEKKKTSLGPKNAFMAV